MPDDPFGYDQVPLVPYKRVRVRYIMKENKSDIDSLIDDVLAKHAAGQGKRGDSVEATAFICAAANAAPVLAQRLKLALEALAKVQSAFRRANTEEKLGEAVTDLIDEINAALAPEIPDDAR